MRSAEQHPQCRHCIHYYVTWDNQRAYGCRALGFQTNRPPCQVVHETSGAPCRMYHVKPTLKAATAGG